MVVLVGLAVGVDYSLFYIRREREERRAGRDAEAALAAAAATSGRAVLISGFTVMAAMAGMYFTGDNGFASLATGTILVVGVAMVGSLTVLPAMLSKLGDRIDKGRIPFLGKRMAQRDESRVWTAVLDRVLRRPLLSAVVSGGMLVALALPTLGLHTASAGIDAIPKDTAVIKTFDRITAAFPGEKAAATVVVKADDVTKPEVAGAIQMLEAKAAGTQDRDRHDRRRDRQGQDVRAGHDPDRRQGHRRRVDGRARADPRRPRAGHGRQGQRRRGRRRRRHRRSPRTTTTWSSTTRRSCSRSSSASRSCSC